MFVGFLVRYLLYYTQILPQRFAAHIKCKRLPGWQPLCVSSRLLLALVVGVRSLSAGLALFSLRSNLFGGFSGFCLLLGLGTKGGDLDDQLVFGRKHRQTSGYRKLS